MRSGCRKDDGLRHRVSGLAQFAGAGVCSQIALDLLVKLSAFLGLKLGQRPAVTHGREGVHHTLQACTVLELAHAGAVERVGGSSGARIQKVEGRGQMSAQAVAGEVVFADGQPGVLGPHGHHPPVQDLSLITL